MDVREKLVELLSEKCMETCKQRKGYVCSVEECKRSKEKCCGFYADHLVAHGVTVQEWVSVDDRLPEINEDETVNCVLVTNGRVIHMAYFVNENWFFCENGQIKRPMFYDVTHWMPLPQPPKGE